jgi:transcriptional regulator of acetoin/glycerol metabolism
MNDKFNRFIKRVSDQALEEMSHYSWPGNVRELKNCMERAFNFCEGDTIQSDDLFDGLPVTTAGCATNEKTLDDLTKNSIINALNQHKTVKQAARSLDIPLATFYRKMKKYGIPTKANR